jgi:Dolichyl-phosphate-mannose-protein mannosyltransferase
VATLTTVVPIVVAFFLLSVAFGVVVPVLEAPDEPSHVAMVRFIATQHALPNQQPLGGFPAGQEGSQPPFYYGLAALLWQLAPGPDLAPTWDDHNPFIRFDRQAEPTDNRALYAHTAAEAFPYRGDILGIHLARLLSAVLGAATVLFTFLLAAELFPRRRLVPLFAAGLVAFNPQFIFSSATVNNDVAAAATSTFVLWCCVRWARRGGSRGLAIALGLGLGAALLAKTGGPLLLVPVGIVLLVDRTRRPSWPSWLGRVALVASLAAVVAGWWFARNQVLYGDPLGWSAMLGANSQMIRSTPIGVQEAASALWRARGTYWGTFGWTNIVYVPSVYQALDLFGLMALGGLVIRAARSARGLDRSRATARLLVPEALIVLWPLLVFASLVHWNQINQAADQWRLLFPAVAAIAILLALGVDALISLPYPSAGAPPSPWAGTGASPYLSPGIGVGLPVTLIVGLVGLGLNVLVLRNVIAPVYFAPSVPAPAGETATMIRFGSGIELVGYRIRPTQPIPGQPLTVDLTWRALRPISINDAVAVTLLGDTGAPVAETRSWPEGGRAPTTAWKTGQVIQDHYVLTPRWEGASPHLAKLWLSLYDPSVVTAPPIRVYDASGKPIGDGVALTSLKLSPTEAARAAPSHPLEAHFGPAFELDGYNLVQTPDTLRLTLVWHATAPPGDSLNVFVHLMDASGHLMTQHDGPPRNGAYPTSFWDVGEIIRDEHVVPLSGVPAGAYQLQVGLYLLATGRRLPVVATTGEPVQDDSLVLTPIEIAP